MAFAILVAPHISFYPELRNQFQIYLSHKRLYLNFYIINFSVFFILEIFRMSKKVN